MSPSSLPDAHARSLTRTLVVWYESCHPLWSLRSFCPRSLHPLIIIPILFHRLISLLKRPNSDTVLLLVSPFLDPRCIAPSDVGPSMPHSSKRETA
ncbi:hypothetical protein VTI74DRAFT_9465 [Chaetomium olivicolor]